jgi:hypothetical protein
MGKLRDLGRCEQETGLAGRHTGHARRAESDGLAL